MFSGGLWIAVSVLGALTAVYLVAVAVSVPRTTPAGTPACCRGSRLRRSGSSSVWPPTGGAAPSLRAVCVAGASGSHGDDRQTPAHRRRRSVRWWHRLDRPRALDRLRSRALLLVPELVSIGRIAFSGRRRAGPWVRCAPLAQALGFGREWCDRRPGVRAVERVLTAPLGVGAVASISYARGVAFMPPSRPGNRCGPLPEPAAGPRCTCRRLCAQPLCLGA